MNRHEELQNRYEDAYFALLMEDVVRIEGEHALEENERLKSDPDSAVPEIVSLRCKRAIRRRFSARTAQTVGHYTAKVFGKVAMLAGIVAILFTAAFAASDTVRVNILNFAIETFETHTTFRFSSFEPDASEDRTHEFSVGWLPEGFSLDDSSCDETECWQYYAKAPDKSVEILTICAQAISALDMDTEGAIVKTVPMHRSDAMLVQKGTAVQLMWVAPDKSFYTHISGIGITSEELIHIAEELNFE